VLIYDHQKGEVADFICIGKEANRIVAVPYYVKAFGGKPENERSVMHIRGASNRKHFASACHRRVS
jgi:hypothetical protein